MNQLYERIRVLCEEKNITIGELSRQAKLNDDDRQALKRGRWMNISLGAAKDIARVLGVSIDSLAEYEPPNLLSSLSRTQLQQAVEAYEAASASGGWIPRSIRPASRRPWASTATLWTRNSSKKRPWSGLPSICLRWSQTFERRKGT